MDSASLKHSPKAFGFGATDHRKAGTIANIRVSDNSITVGIAVKLDIPTETSNDALGENEISLNYLASFLNNAYHFAEETDVGIHHRVVFKHEKPEGVE